MPTTRTLGALPAPAWHRPWFRYVDPVDGAQATPPTPTPAAPKPSLIPDPAPVDSGAKPDEPLGATGLAALQAERDARKAADKALADARAKIQQYEDKDKSAQQLADDALAKAKAELAEVTVAKTRAEVAAEKGVPAALLTGSTQEEIEASADALLQFKGATPAPPTGPVVPTEGTGNGQGGASQLSKADLESMSPEQINQARRDGRLNKILGIS